LEPWGNLHRCVAELSFQRSDPALAGRIAGLARGRRVILASLALLGITIATLSLTTHIVFLIFMFGVLSGTVFSGVSPSNTSALVSKWFRRRRATAVGINASGVALAGLLMIPLTSYMIQVIDWRLTWLVLGLMVLFLAGPIVFLLVHDGPEKIGLEPDGDPRIWEEQTRQSPNRRTGPLETTRWAESFRSWPLWQVSATYFVDGITGGNLLVHLVPYAIDRGVSPSTAAFVFGVMMVLGIVGSMAAGMISEGMHRKTLLAITYLVRGCAYAVVLLLPGIYGLWIFAAVIGFTFMAPVPLTTSLTADIYGLRALGAITGVSYLFRQIGGTVGILLTGYLFDVTGSYTLPFAVAGFLLLPAALTAFLVNERKNSARYQLESVS